MLFQYLRIYEKGSKFYIVTLATIVFTILWGLAYSIIGWIPTVPVAGFWKMEMPATRYGYGSLDVRSFVGTYESHAAINMLLDAVVLAIAVPMFFKQGMRKNSYWGLLGLFVLGGVCVSPLPRPEIVWLTRFQGEHAFYMATTKYRGDACRHYAYL